jgi:hypothetical protein
MNMTNMFTPHVSYVPRYVNRYTIFDSTASLSYKDDNLLSHWALYHIVGIKNIVFKVSSLTLATDHENR